MVAKLTSLSQSIEDSIDTSNLTIIKSSKLTKVNIIKRYDVVYTSVLGGVPHYFMVDKVVGDDVYCVCFSSTFKDNLILHTVLEDRIFENNFVVNTHFTLSLDECKKSFVRVYEDKREALAIFSKIRKYYKSVFNF